MMEKFLKNVTAVDVELQKGKPGKCINQTTDECESKINIGYNSRMVSTCINAYWTHILPCDV